jgi:hypothetical protein
MNWNIASEANAGTDRGKMMRKNILVLDAPSRLADSISSFGRDTKKFLKRNTARGSP